MKYFKWKTYTIPSEIFVTKDWFRTGLDNCHLVIDRYSLIFSDSDIMKVLLLNGKNEDNIKYLPCYKIIHDINFIEMSLEKYNNIKVFL